MLPENYSSLMNSIKLLDTKLIHRNLLHFYILNSGGSEREIKEIIPFSITSKRIKYLGVNLLKHVKDLYENYMMLIKEIEDNTAGGKIHSFLGLE